MPEPVDIVFAAEFERRIGRRLIQWQKLHGENSATWTTGDTEDGRKIIFDVPIRAVGFLFYDQLPLETRRRDPKRPLPGFNTTPQGG